MNLRFLNCLAIACAISGLTAGPARSASLESNSKPPLKIGAILILSGTASNFGYYAQRGARLAQEEINKAGGVDGRQLQLIYEDESGSRAQPALNAYRKLTTQDGVKFILGPNFQDALTALAPIAQREDVFLITPSTPTSEKTPSNIFSTWPDPEVEADLLAKQIIQKSKKLAILSVQQAWEAIVDARLIKTFSSLGGEIVSHATPVLDTTDVRTDVLRLKANMPDAIVISSYALFGIYAKELKKQGITVPLYGIEVDQAAIDSAGGSAEGLTYIGPELPESTFTKRYRDVFGSTPDVPASNSYDAVKLLANAIKTVGNDPKKVSNYFRENHTFKGASGSISSVNGRTKMSTAFFTVANGKFARTSISAS